MGRQRLDWRVEKHRLAAPFRISGYVFEAIDYLVATLTDGDLQGRGEAAGVYYLGDTAEHMVDQLEHKRPELESCDEPEQLRSILPLGGARNAVDCALWDLRAKRTGEPAWRTAGLERPRPLVTTMTVGADEPDKMADAARQFAQARAIKLKLTGELELDIERVRAVRAARPDVWLGVDANQGFSIGELDPLATAIVEQGVALIEQPLARGHEQDLAGFECPIPLAADESALGLDDVDGLVGRFQVVNIKLDKCGGLTEALLIVGRARELGLGVMVGNMTGTSLAMAPAFLVGQRCDIVDLDGPLFLTEDRQPSVEYRNGTIHCPESIWGAPAMCGTTG